jgi:hypothetical protein
MVSPKTMFSTARVYMDTKFDESDKMNSDSEDGFVQFY